MFNKTLDKIISKAKIPGLSMAIGSQTGKILTLVAGVSNKNTRLKVTDTTIFEAASLSKPVFAYIVLKIAESGRLNLDKPLYEIYPEFGPPSLRNHPHHKMLTARRILSHQAGLPNWFQWGQPDAYMSVPGENFDYSGIGFSFLNDVIEKISEGKKLEDLAQEVFQDLEMHHSSFLPHTDGKLSKYPLARGHDADENPDQQEHFLSGSEPNPAASLLTTAEDYVKFLQACINDDFIRKHMFEPQVGLAGKDTKAMNAGVSPKALECMYWGLGIGLQKNPDGSMIAFHWGDIKTNRAIAVINLQTNQSVVCLTNSANGPSIFRRIIEPVVGNIAVMSHWLSRREGLKLNKEPKTSAVLSKEFGFFKKLEDQYLEEHRHQDSKLQHEYDKRFGIVPKK